MNPQEEWILEAGNALKPLSLVSITNQLLQKENALKQRTIIIPIAAFAHRIIVEMKIMKMKEEEQEKQTLHHINLERINLEMRINSEIVEINLSNNIDRDRKKSLTQTSDL